MPTITAETARAEVTIAGQKFTVPQPYAAGHVLAENEAAALNQTFSENVRNNIAARIRANEEAPEAERTVIDQSTVDEYAEGYEFGVRRSAEARLSPEEREARAIAKSVIEQQLKAKNMAKPDKDTLDGWIKELAGQEQVVKEAKRRVKEASKMAEGFLNQPAAQAAAAA